MFRFSRLLVGVLIAFFCGGSLVWAQNEPIRSDTFIQTRNSRNKSSMTAEQKKAMQQKVRNVADAIEKDENCGDSCPMPYGVKSCLGIKKDDTTTTFNKVGSVKYGSTTYDVGENKGEYCMRNKAIKMGCEYIGAGEASSKVGSFEESDFCCGTKLNTDVPFVGRCVTVDGAMDDQSGAVSAFPRLMKALSRIVLTLIFVGSMIMLVASGVMRASGNPGEGKKMIKRVVLSLVLLGASGIILKLINPVFFG